MPSSDAVRSRPSRKDCPETGSIAGFQVGFEFKHILLDSSPLLAASVDLII